MIIQKLVQEIVKATKKEFDKKYLGKENARRDLLDEFDPREFIFADITSNKDEMNDDVFLENTEWFYRMLEHDSSFLQTNIHKNP